MIALYGLLKFLPFLCNASEVSKISKKKIQSQSGTHIAIFLFLKTLLSEEKKILNSHADRSSVATAENIIYYAVGVDSRL